MRTLIIIASGFVLLGFCMLAPKLAGGKSSAFAKAALFFLPLWLIAAGVNMWIGVAKAGYTVKEELPIFLLIFAVPAVPAIILWRKFSG
jgi:hypothetical protein